MKNRAFVKYKKNGEIVPGSLILTNGAYPQGGPYKEITIDLCCDNLECPTPNYGRWGLVTGGEAGDGQVLVENLEDQEFTFIGPNDSEDEGWVYLKQYFPTETCLEINYEWTSFDDGLNFDKPVYWWSTTEPTGIPDDIGPKVGLTPESGTWEETVPPGNWFAVGIYSNDSCCGRGFLSIEINEVTCP